jgi:hypothetical protein
MIFDQPNILAVSKVLQNAEIQHANYANCFDRVNENTFVYFDPPYRPISQTASFTTYTGTEFSDKEQLQLAHFFQQLDQEKGAKLMLSNSDPKNQNPKDDFFEKAFAGYNIFRVSASRAINCDGEKRGKITELLITNYKPKFIMEYRCKKCGGNEFISEPNKYDVFEGFEGKIRLKSSEYTNEKLVLFCRDCSEVLEFAEDDVKI